MVWEQPDLKPTENLWKTLTFIRTVFLRDLIGTYVDNCQHAVFTCFSMLMRGVFKYIFCLLVMDMQD